VSFLLDTNVVSEVPKSRADADVLAWMASVTAADLYLSVLVVGEIRRGVEGLRRRDPAQAAVYDVWLTGLRRDYADRILPVTAEIAEEWGRLNVPDPIPTIDGLLAATAKVHGLTLVTRNTADVARTGVPLLNPFDIDGSQAGFQRR
jgi:predicted nucleic acid-binding protein